MCDYRNIKMSHQAHAAPPSVGNVARKFRQDLSGADTVIFGYGHVWHIGGTQTPRQVVIGGHCQKLFEKYSFF